MEKIKRPIEVSRAEQAILTDKNFQANVKQQLKNIYDKVDEIVDVIANGYQGDVGPVRTAR